MDLIKPEVPNAQDNKAPFIMLEGMRIGLQAAAQFAQMRRNSESEMMRLAEHERLANDAHELEKQKLAENFELRDRELTMAEELLPYRERYLDSLGETKKTAMMQMLQFNQQRGDLVNEANADAEKLGLNNPQFPVKNPVEFAANSMKFESQWGFGESTIPEINAAVQRFRTVRDQHKIELPSYTKKDANGVLIPGPTKSIPIYRVVEGLQNPDTHDQFRDILVASGHIKTDEKEVPTEGRTNALFRHPIDTLWDKFVKGPAPTKKVTTDIPDERASQWIDQSKSVDFAPEASKLPAVMLPKSHGRGNQPTRLPEPDLPEESAAVDDPQASLSKAFDPTQTDTYIQLAKDAISRGAPREAVAQRLQEEFGVDPGKLWAA